ncbi:hypothetical protein L6467_01545 [Segatella bryantii]|uniref:hypothetical protein n=1 Tax=Segatella bryantii TaxID=77095 RepID=UPI001EDBA813|nr:hypothetical protein [Segatella bryantii]UKK72564.1 hypothetical protein L6467_01545 [Segatella bryantii]
MKINMIKNCTHRLLLLVFLMQFYQNSKAQLVLTESTNKQIAGDKVVYNLVEDIFHGAMGEDVVWDFSNCNILDNTYPIYFKSDSIGIKSIEPGLQKYHIQVGDTLFMRAYRTSLETMNYTLPIISMCYPFSYGDSITSQFTGKGKYCESYDKSQHGTKMIVGDAKGRIILPNNSVLNDVLRVHSVTYSDVALEGLEPNLVDTAKTKQVLIDKYDWYVKGYRYPVFEYRISTSYNDGLQVASKTESYCSLPDSVMQLAKSIDEKGQHCEEYFKVANDSLIQDEFPMIYQKALVDNMLSLAYKTTIKATVTFVVASTTGIIYQNKTCNCEAGEMYETSFNCNGYKPGGYILYINVNGKISSEKFQVK